MNDIINKIPQFWQGVIGSILATILILIFTKVFGLFSNEIKESKKQRAKKLEELKEKILSQDSVSRVEGYFQILFTILKYLFVANISWVVSGIFSFDVLTYSLFIIICLLCFYLGLRQIFTVYKVLKKDTIFYKHSLNENDLVIQFAEYGFGEKYFDVTDKLRALLENNEIELVTNNDTFGDSHPGKVKSLNVVYTYRGKTHKRVITEGETLKLP